MSGRHRQGAHFPPWLLFNSRSVKFPLYYLWGKWYYYHWLDIIITKSSSSCQGPCCYSGCRWSWAWPCRTWRAWGLRRGHRACSPSPGHSCLPPVTTANQRPVFRSHDHHRPIRGWDYHTNEPIRGLEADNFPSSAYCPSLPVLPGACCWRSPWLPSVTVSCWRLINQRPILTLRTKSKAIFHCTKHWQLKDNSH